MPGVSSECRGWGKVKAAARYCGLSERRFRDLLKEGLPYSRLPRSGTILISFEKLDHFLAAHEVTGDRTDKINKLVDEALKGL